MNALLEVESREHVILHRPDAHVGDDLHAVLRRRCGLRCLAGLDELGLGSGDAAQGAALQQQGASIFPQQLHDAGEGQGPAKEEKFQARLEVPLQRDGTPKLLEVRGRVGYGRHTCGPRELQSHPRVAQILQLLPQRLQGRGCALPAARWRCKHLLRASSDGPGAIQSQFSGSLRGGAEADALLQIRVGGLEVHEAQAHSRRGLEGLGKNGLLCLLLLRLGQIPEQPRQRGLERSSVSLPASGHHDVRSLPQRQALRTHGRKRGAVEDSLQHAQLRLQCLTRFVVQLPARDKRGQARGHLLQRLRTAGELRHR
mmetsp:Transcript_26234/g.55641  ORF Transcript_26234/g.55641 Transcript_26234/m.55641 type:complete len:313 (+) Transcript_26234:2796-3734(+)